MSKRSMLFLLVVPLALLAAAAGPTRADGQVGSVQLGGDTISVFPQISYQSLSISVAGEGMSMQGRFGPGETASISLSENGPIIDGNYSYQIVLSPPTNPDDWESAEGNERVQQLLARQEAENTHRREGTFSVSGGTIVADGL